jgi:hypothetical protein
LFVIGATTRSLPPSLLVSITLVRTGMMDSDDDLHVLDMMTCA